MLSGAAHGETARAPAAGSSKTKDLKRIRKNISNRQAHAARLRKTVREIAAKMSDLRTRSVALAAKVRDRERHLIKLERQIAGLAREEKRLATGFDQRQQQLARILAILQRIRVHPPVLLAMNGDKPNDSVRAAIVIQRLAPHLRKEAAQLSAQQRKLIKVRRRLVDDRAATLRARRALDQERQEIRTLLTRQTGLLRVAAQEQAGLRNELAALRRRAKDMQQLLGRLETSRRKSADTWSRTAASTRPSALRPLRPAVATLPAAGEIIRRFGGLDEHGERSKGIVVRARAGATVVAPWDGQIQFAGRFRNFGRILIIRHGGGYHSVLLGLKRIDVVVRQWVLAGEPVGVIGEFKASGPELYYEIRKVGRPVNPLPWLAADQRNVR